jgi:phospholipid-translocating P-type ATPase (flippase)
MTVVCEYKGEFFCITKGADNVMSPITDDGAFSKVVQDRLTEYSLAGLRTLAITSKIVERSFLEQWHRKWMEAQHSPKEERAERMAAVAALMERDLQLSGITAIEDKLQKGVPAAITSIKAAGIRFWVLTGDKTETAVEIVRACNLFTSGMTIAYCTKASSAEHALELLQDAQKALSGTTEGGIVLDGTFVGFVLESEQARSKLYQLAISTTSCVCCRLSPQQKRRLVDLVRVCNPRSITLAIGDGANDAPMIQGAHVGVGVIGKEGNQAVQVSDIAISQFRFLVPLLLLHGRRAYRRVATFLCYYLYKHLVLVIMDVIWAHQFSFKGETAVHEMLSNAYSAMLTIHPVILTMGFDKDVPDEVALQNPQLYQEGLQRTRFNAFVFGCWVLSAIWHGSVAWLVPFAFFGTANVAGTEDPWTICEDPFTKSSSECWEEGFEDQKFWTQSCVAMTILVVMVNLRLWMFAMNRLSWITLLAVLSSLLFYLIALLVLSVHPFSWMFAPQLYNQFTMVFSNADILLVILITPLTSLLDFVVYLTHHALYPTLLDTVRWGKQLPSARPG